MTSSTNTILTICKPKPSQQPDDPATLTIFENTTPNQARAIICSDQYNYGWKKEDIMSLNEFQLKVLNSYPIPIKLTPQQLKEATWLNNNKFADILTYVLRNSWVDENNAMSVLQAFATHPEEVYTRFDNTKRYFFTDLEALLDFTNFDTKKELVMSESANRQQSLMVY